MEKTFKLTIAFLFVLASGFYLRGQDLDRVDVDLNHIYNEWAFSKLESKDGLVIYREKEDFFVNNIRYRAGASVKFSKSDNVFLLNYNDGKVYRRCGNDGRKNSPPSWKKGIWKLIEEDENVLLELKYFVAEKGRDYKLASKELYKIVYLEEDKMILRKFENDI